MQLYTTNQASQILNISLQGVHYRIKNGTLKSVKQNGKTYVYVDPASVAQENEKKSKVKNKKQKQSQKNMANDAIQYIQVPTQMSSQQNSQINQKDDKLEIILDKIIHTKDEQIQILKKSIKGIKEQYSIEIARLQNNNEKEIARLTQNQDKIIEVFSSEIKLLQQAFQEMKNVYLIGIEKKGKQQEKQAQSSEAKVSEEEANSKQKKDKKTKQKERFEEDIKVKKTKKTKQKEHIEEDETKAKKSKKEKLKAIPHKEIIVEKEEIKQEIKEEIIEVKDEPEDGVQNADMIIDTLKQMTRPKTLEIKDFYELMKTHNKQDYEIKELIMQKVIQGDDRFEYNKEKKELIIYDKNFSDLY